MSSSSEAEEMEFDWVQLRQDMDKISISESGVEKLFRKFRENPLVPIGMYGRIDEKAESCVILGSVATAVVLGYGLWCFRNGNRKMSQIMMRTRVAVQGFTVFALLAGIGLSAKKVRE